MPDDFEDDETWGESGPDDDYEDESESEPTRECPYCRREMLEICLQCPSCGQYLSEEDTPLRGHQPRWVILGAILCLGVLFFWILISL